MKKILSIVALVGIGLSAQAANFLSQNFLTVQAVYATNQFAITNLSTAGSHGTNTAGVVYTNNNVRVAVNGTAGTTNVVASQRNLLKDVTLYPNSLGEWYFPTVTNSQTLAIYSPYNIHITTTNSSGSVGVLQLIFTPIYNGVDEATASAEEWTVGLTPTASSRHTLVTNVPIWRWPGAAKLRLRRITNTGAAASTECILTDVSFNGFIP